VPRIERDEQVQATSVEIDARGFCAVHAAGVIPMNWRIA
jgi:hypothetical protein